MNGCLSFDLNGCLTPIVSLPQTNNFKNTLRDTINEYHFYKGKGNFFG